MICPNCLPRSMVFEVSCGNEVAISVYTLNFTNFMTESEVNHFFHSVLFLKCK